MLHIISTQKSPPPVRQLYVTIMCTLESSRIAICTEKLQKQRVLGLAGSQMKGNLDRLGSGQICKLVSLSGLLLFETDFWQKNSTLFLVLGSLFTWNLFGLWNARFANSPTQLPLKSSVHTHAWNLIAWNCGAGFDFAEKLLVNEEKSRLGGFVRPTCYLKSTAPYWAEVQFTQTDQYWLSMNLPRFRFMGPDEKASFSFLNDFTLRLSWFRDGRP